jgi:hypothetical protein
MCHNPGAMLNGLTEVRLILRLAPWRHARQSAIGQGSPNVYPSYVKTDSPKRRTTHAEPKRGGPRFRRASHRNELTKTSVEITACGQWGGGVNSRHELSDR